MIKGIGVDIINLNRIKILLKKTYSKNFIKKVLSEKELVNFKNNFCENEKILFLGKRWAIKESIVKSLNLKDIIFSHINICENNKIYFEKKNMEKFKDIIDFEKLNSLKNKYIVFLSDNDRFINPHSATQYYSQINTLQIVPFHNAGHFMKSE